MMENYMSLIFSIVGYAMGFVCGYKYCVKKISEREV